MRVLVTGATEPSPHATEIAKAVGASVAQNGFVLLTGGMHGVDAASAGAAHAVCKSCRLDPAQRIISYVTGDKTPGHSHGDIRRSKHAFRTLGVPEIVDLADAIVTIQGGAGTETIANYAFLLKKPYLPLGASGGASEKLWRAMQGDLERYFDPDVISLDSFGPLGNINASPQELADSVITAINTARQRMKAFIVHGHDYRARQELGNFIADELNLVPIVLDEQPDSGLTVIEKFEKHASRCTVAFAILTPDDPGSSPQTPLMKRSRQNVILEVGWFMGRMGRERVMLLTKGDIEFPSDLYGVLHLRFRKNITETSDRIRKHLRYLQIIS